MPGTIAVIGECMLELRHASACPKNDSMAVQMSYGGDTMNTAIYMARKAIDVSYFSALGDDQLSDWLLQQWSKEGVDCSGVSRYANAVPGLYMISLSDEGERSFLYWRKQSPASQIVDSQEKAIDLVTKLGRYDYVYLSGISLAILDEQSRDRLFDVLNKLVEQGVHIIFDGNYRPKLWASKEEAQEAYRRVYQLASIALPTLDDEKLLFGLETAEQVIYAIHGWGAKEVVVKLGEQGCLAMSEGVIESVEAKPVSVVDTTAAGDSFNAAYISSRLKGESVTDACRAGHELAGQVIQHQGAIMPI